MDHNLWLSTKKPKKMNPKLNDRRHIFIELVQSRLVLKFEIMNKVYFELKFIQLNIINIRQKPESAHFRDEDML